jgi:ABC-type polysaccharide/polyol phosphate export permease
MSIYSDLRDSRGLLLNLTRREVQGKYKRTLLGQAWSLFNPVASLLTYSLVFSFVLRVPVPIGDPSGLQNFTLYLACALLPWNFFTAAITTGMSSLVGNSNLLSKVYFYRQVLVLSAVLACNFTFAIELTVLVVAVLMLGGAPLVWLPMVVIFVLLLTLFAAGIGLALSVVNVYFRDTQHIMTIVLQIWFYATSIVYPFSLIRDKAASLRADGNHFPLEFVYRLNPMERFVEFSRSLLYDNRWPTAGTFVYCAVAALVSITVGMAVFQRLQGRVVEEL